MLWQRGKAYSQDLRERVLAAADDGVAVGRIAALLRVSVSYVSKVLSRRRQTGQTTARPQRCQMTPNSGTCMRRSRVRWACARMRRWRSYGVGYARRTMFRRATA
jgi:transposase